MNENLTDKEREIVGEEYEKHKDDARLTYEDDRPCRKCPKALLCESTDCPKRFKPVKNKK
jgi:hypothetical protein